MPLHAGGPVSLDAAPAYLDVLCLAPKALPASELPARVLRPALRAQLGAMQQAMIAQGALCTLRALHFLPPGWAHPLTLVYPLGLHGAGKVCCHATLPQLHLVLSSAAGLLQWHISFVWAALPAPALEGWCLRCMHCETMRWA
jgi:hypothetical protein